MKEKKFSLEDTLKRLEEILQILESGEKELEESIELFEEGMKLADLCHSHLQGLENRVKILVEKGEGGYVEKDVSPKELK